MPSLQIETKKIYHQIRQDVISIHYRAAILSALFARGDTRYLLEQASWLFFRRIAENDLLDTIVLDLARLLDPAVMGRNGAFVNASLAKLIEEVTLLDTLAANQLTVHRNKLIQDLPNIDTWRDKWAAHRDYNTTLIMRTYPNAVGRPHFTLQQIENALPELDACLNIIESVFADVGITPTTEDEAENLIPIAIDYAREFSAVDEIRHLLKVISAGVDSVVLKKR